MPGWEARALRGDRVLSARGKNEAVHQGSGVRKPLHSRMELSRTKMTAHEAAGRQERPQRWNSQVLELNSNVWTTGKMPQWTRVVRCGCAGRGRQHPLPQDTISVQLEMVRRFTPWRIQQTKPAVVLLTPATSQECGGVAHCPNWRRKFLIKLGDFAYLQEHTMRWKTTDCSSRDGGCLNSDSHVTKLQCCLWMLR